MTGMAHEAPRPARSSAVFAAWAVLVGMGGTSVTYNVYHAVHHGSMNLGLALLYGIAPVFAAALLSHIVAEHDGGRFLQAVTFAVMLGAMTLSIGATASVVEPASGPWMQWLFGAVLDAAALVALRVILSGRKRKAEAVAAMEAAQGTLSEAERIATEAAGSVAEAEQKAAQFEAELATTKAALEAERERRLPARNRRRSSARKPAAASARNQAPEPAPEVTPEPAPVPVGSSAPEDVPDLDAEARILKYIAEGHSASKAGVLAGKSDSYGRTVARLAKAAKTEPAGDDRSDGDAL
jgi:hypothetical protein